MSRWFRHYAGMMRDEKLVRVAVKAKQPIERVVWVWGAILESAAEINDNGRYELDPAEAAYFLRCDEHDLVSIVDGLVSLGRLAEGMVARWADRQFNSDSAKERQRRYRERLAARSDVQQRNNNVGKTQRDVTRDVTQPSRDGAVTAQENRDRDITDASASDAVASDDPRRILWNVGVADLKAMTGKTDDAAKSLIGKWLKATNDDCSRVLSKIRTARAERIGEPVAWITAALKPPTPPPRQPRNVGELAFMRLNGTYPHEPSDTDTRRLDLGDGRRQIEGVGDVLEPALGAKHVAGKG